MKQLFQQTLKISILLVFVFWAIFGEFYIKCRLSSSSSSPPPPQTYEGTVNLETCFSRGQGVLGLSIFVCVILYPASAWLAFLDDFCVCSFPVTCLFVWFFISFDILSTFNVLQILTYLWQSTVRWNSGLKASHSCLFQFRASVLFLVHISLPLHKGALEVILCNLNFISLTIHFIIPL